MKFNKGDIVYRWTGGDGYSDGSRFEIIAYDQRIDGMYYLCDNLSSDNPRFQRESALVDTREWSSLVARMLFGDLTECDCAHKLHDIEWNAYTGWKHIQYRQPRYAKK